MRMGIISTTLLMGGARPASLATMGRSLLGSHSFSKLLLREFPGNRSRRNRSGLRFSRGFWLLIAAVLPLGSLGCFGEPEARAERLEFKVVETYPHDVQAFTQGLLFHDGFLYESTGQYGESTLRRVDPESGRVEQVVHLPRRFFGEGLAWHDGRLYQLTWKEGTGFVYDPGTLEKTGEFTYEGEGWGLTSDGQQLIMSNGTPKLRFLNPETFEVTRELTVRDAGVPVEKLNELEYVEGRILANLWTSDDIVCIDPATGHVTARLDVSRLQRPRPPNRDAVANGIAYDPDTRLLFLTGKRWPKLYAVRIEGDIP